MRTRAVLAGVFASVSILVIGWQIGESTAQNTITTLSTSLGSTGSGAAGSTASSSAAPTAPAVSATPAPAAPSSDGTWTGSIVNTRYGPVQVQVVISNAVITGVTELQLPSAEGRSVQINNRAAPILQQELLAAQSANVQNVSGATYTSEAYAKSVQSALDQAGL